MRAQELTVFVDDLLERIKSTRELLDKLDREHKQTLQTLNDMRRELEVKNALLQQQVDLLTSAKAERIQEREEHVLLNREVEDLKKWKEEQKKDRDEKSRRLWSSGPNIAGAVATAVLSIIISIATLLIVSYFNRSQP